MTSWRGLAAHQLEEHSRSAEIEQLASRNHHWNSIDGLVSQNLVHEIARRKVVVVHPRMARGNLLPNDWPVVSQP